MFENQFKNYLKIIMIFLNYMMVIKVIKHIDSLVY